jgi:DNA-binding MarR family transcriptional regulator
MGDNYLVSDDYFQLMLELAKTSNIVRKSLSNHIKKFGIKSNDSQIIILHFIEKVTGNLSHTELMKNLGFMYTNPNYSIESLISNGHILRKNGEEIGMDHRCSFLSITSEGKAIYDKVCDYAQNKIDELEKHKKWGEKNFDSLLTNLNLIQEVIRRDL